MSVLKGDGLDLLRAQLLDLARGGRQAHGAFSARSRHVQALDAVTGHLNAAAAQLEQRSGELAAEELRHAQSALGEITGDVTSDDLLGAIFSTFCIGK
jgi:tRNA modification GTPase